MSSVIKTFPRKYCNYAGREWNLPTAVHSIFDRDETRHTVTFDDRIPSIFVLLIVRATEFSSYIDGITLLIAVRYENCIKCENEVVITFDERDATSTWSPIDQVKDCSISVKLAHF